MSLKPLQLTIAFQVNRSIEACHRITVTPEFRERERLYSKARHDEAQALQHERLLIAKKMLNHGESIEKIIIFTDLTREEIEGLGGIH